MTVIGKDSEGYNIVKCDTCGSKIQADYIGHFEGGIVTHKCHACCIRDGNTLPPTPEMFAYDGLGRYGKDWYLMEDMR